MNKKRARIIDLEDDIFKEGEAEDHPVDGFVKDHQARIINLNIKQIQPNPEQPRKQFNQEALQNLADSIKARGLLQPVIVKKLEDDKFILVAGERRWRACQLVGLKRIQALVSSDNELEIALIENMQREDLSAIEEAEGLQLLANKFNYTHDQLAKTVNKSRTSITEILSLNKLPEEVKTDCRTFDNCPKVVLLQVVRQKKEDKMLALWKKIREGQLTVRETKKIVKGGKKTIKKRPVQLLITTSNKLLKQANSLDFTSIEKEEREVLANNLGGLFDQLKNLLEKINYK